jgi:hypothetical protein
MSAMRKERTLGLLVVNGRAQGNTLSASAAASLMPGYTFAGLDQVIFAIYGNSLWSNDLNSVSKQSKREAASRIHDAML